MVLRPRAQAALIYPYIETQSAAICVHIRQAVIVADRCTHSGHKVGSSCRTTTLPPCDLLSFDIHGDNFFRRYTESRNLAVPPLEVKQQIGNLLGSGIAP